MIKYLNPPISLPRCQIYGNRIKRQKNLLSRTYYIIVRIRVTEEDRKKYFAITFKGYLTLCGHFLFILTVLFSFSQVITLLQDATLNHLYQFKNNACLKFT